MLYALARRLSLAVQNQTCEYLIQKAAMAFTPQCARLPLDRIFGISADLRFLPKHYKPSSDHNRTSSVRRTEFPPRTRGAIARSRKNPSAEMR
jgi:hypothetical protein